MSGQVAAARPFGALAMGPGGAPLRWSAAATASTTGSATASLAFADFPRPAIARPPPPPARVDLARTRHARILRRAVRRFTRTRRARLGGRLGDDGSCVDDPLLPFGSATAIATAIRPRRISSVEAVTACLARIDEVDPALHALVRRAPDALERAVAADAALARGEPAARSTASHDHQGLARHGGPRHDRRDNGRASRAERDATVVRARARGGRDHPGQDEHARPDPERRDVEPRRRGVRTTRSTSRAPPADRAEARPRSWPRADRRSRSGATPAAASACPPSAADRGLKPTGGRVPRTGHIIITGGVAVPDPHRPVARRVDDLAARARDHRGAGRRGSHVVPSPLGDPSTVDVGALRIAWFTDNGLHAPTPETRAAVRDRRDRPLRDVGAILISVAHPGLERAPELWQRFVDADGKAWLHRLMAAAGTEEPGSFAHRGDYRPEPIPSADLTKLVEDLDDLRGRLRRWLRDEGIDLVLGPAMPQPAVHHGESYAPWFADSYSDVHNLTGWPALVVRGGTGPGGLPIGVQLVANPWREDVAIAAAFVVEAASGGWQRPPL